MTRFRLFSIGIGCLLIAACAMQNPSSEQSVSSVTEASSSNTSETVLHSFTADDHVTFPTGSASLVITKSVEPFDKTILDGRTVQTDYCSTLTQGQASSLHAAFDNTMMTVYTISDPRFSRWNDADLFVVYVLPNAAHYTTMAAFKHDFDFCAVAGQYPTTLNGSWLVMISALCGGAGGPSADECSAVDTLIEGHIQLR